MSKLKENSYIVIFPWMIEELKLKGTDLLVYAIIHGYSNAPDQKFTGSLQYLAEWCKSSKQTIITSLKKLVSNGYINKTDMSKNGVKFCEYEVVKKVDTYSNLAKTRPESAKKEIFKAPTLEEVSMYVAENRFNISAEKFVAHYEANNWYRGKTKLKDWKAAVRYWNSTETNQVRHAKINRNTPPKNERSGELKDWELALIEEHKNGL